MSVISQYNIILVPCILTSMLGMREFHDGLNNTYWIRSSLFRSTSDPNIGAQLRKHISSPYFIPPGHSHMDLAWIFMGAPGPGASIHVSTS